MCVYTSIYIYTRRESASGRLPLQRDHKICSKGSKVLAMKGRDEGVAACVPTRCRASSPDLQQSSPYTNITFAQTKKSPSPRDLFPPAPSP